MTGRRTVFAASSELVEYDSCVDPELYAGSRDKWAAYVESLPSPYREDLREWTQRSYASRVGNLARDQTILVSLPLLAHQTRVMKFPEYHPEMIWGGFELPYDRELSDFFGAWAVELASLPINTAYRARKCDATCDTVTVWCPIGYDHRDPLLDHDEKVCAPLPLAFPETVFCRRYGEIDVPPGAAAQNAAPRVDVVMPRTKRELRAKQEWRNEPAGQCVGATYEKLTATLVFTASIDCLLDLSYSIGEKPEIQIVLPLIQLDGSISEPLTINMPGLAVRVGKEGFEIKDTSSGSVTPILAWDPSKDAPSEAFAKSRLVLTSTSRAIDAKTQVEIARESLQTSFDISAKSKTSMLAEGIQSKEKGNLRIATSANADGRFKINVKTNQILEIFINALGKPELKFDLLIDAEIGANMASLFQNGANCSAVIPALGQPLPALGNSWLGSGLSEQTKKYLATAGVALAALVVGGLVILFIPQMAAAAALGAVAGIIFVPVPQREWDVQKATL